jgi:uncharacterized coiled-coil protein SlyX
VDQHSFQVISVLASTLLTVVSGIVRALYTRNQKLEAMLDEQNQTLRKNNEALIASNKAIEQSNAALVEALAALRTSRGGS